MVFVWEHIMSDITEFNVNTKQETVREFTANEKSQIEAIQKEAKAIVGIEENN